MTLSQELSYNQVPYPNLSHYSTHPDCLATMARLVGVPTAAIESCRVLELGAAAGGNIIPMAYILPGSEFLGIDISDVQVTAGQKKIADLGFTNIRLDHMDILDVTEALGQFDYIIAHGVFSWVPLVVQEKVLEICHQNLAPNGVAMVSYNTYPGWHLINIARDMMRFHTRDLTDPKERADKAREMLRFYSDADPTDKVGYYGFLKMYADYIEGKLDDDGTPKFDSALLHDELSELNQPFYFHEFIERAEAHDLQYLGDLQTMKLDLIAPQVLESVQKNAKNLVDLEQTMDFLLNQTFRKTVVCHKGMTINRKVKPDQAKRFFFASQARIMSDEPKIHTRSVEEFQTYDRYSLKMDHPLSKAAMICLRDTWPCSSTFDELVLKAKAWLEKDGERIDVTQLDEQVLGANLLRAFSYNPGLVELHVYRNRLTSQVGVRPMASMIARYDLEREETVTNLRHERVVLTDLERFILPYLDGSHDREDFLRILMEGPVAEGVLTLERDGELLAVSEQRTALARDLEHSLQWLAQAGLLIDSSAMGGDADGI